MGKFYIMNSSYLKRLFKISICYWISLITCVFKGMCPFFLWVVKFTDIKMFIIFPYNSLNACRIYSNSSFFSWYWQLVFSLLFVVVVYFSQFYQFCFFSKNCFLVSLILFSNFILHNFLFSFFSILSLLL